MKWKLILILIGIGVLIVGGVFILGKMQTVNLLPEPRQEVIMASSFNPEDDRTIGYELLDNGKVVHIWNTQDDYFFNKSSGIQFTNHYQNYWSKNIFCLGYYDGEEWIKIKCADELNGFTKMIDTDNETYVNATLWKDTTYQGYNMRLGINYYLGLDNETLSITIYGKNIGADIPYDLGFAWKIKDVEIATEEEDHISLNNTEYHLNETFDLLFKNMTKIDFNEETNETIITPIPRLKIYDRLDFLNMDWNESLDYVVKMYGDGNQENFYIALLINAGHFNPNQEKSTTFQWIDAVYEIVGLATYNDNVGDYSVDNIRSIAISSDGNYLFTSSGNDDYVSIMNVTDKSNIVQLASYYDASGDYSVNNLYSMVISPDGDYLFTSSSVSDYVSIMNVTDKTSIVPLATYTDTDGDYSIENPRAITISSNGNYLYTSSTVDDYVSIMNVTNKTSIVPLATYTDSDGDYSIDFLTSLAISSNGNYLYTSSTVDDYVSIMNVTDKTSIVPLATYYDVSGDYSVESIHSLAISPDGNYLFTSSSIDDYVSIMNVTDKTSIVPLATYYDVSGDYSVDGIQSIAISSDGNYLFTSSNIDDCVSIMDVTDKTSIVPLASYCNAVGDYSVEEIASLVVFNDSDGNYLFTSSLRDDRVSTMQFQEVLDTTSPQWFDNSTNSTVAGTYINHSVRWTDAGLSGYIFSFNNGSGTFANDTWVSMTGTSNWSNVSKIANHTVGSTIQWQVYANDTASPSNWNLTDTFQYDTTSADTCPCPSINTNWGLDLSDYCVISSACDIGTGNITFTNTGNITFNATITALDIGDLPASQRGYLTNNGKVFYT